jgi:hypothetical protein
LGRIRLNNKERRSDANDRICLNCHGRCVN